MDFFDFFPSQQIDLEEKAFAQISHAKHLKRRSFTKIATRTHYLVHFFYDAPKMESERTKVSKLLTMEPLI